MPAIELAESKCCHAMCLVRLSRDNARLSDVFMAALIKSESKTDFIARYLANAATLAFILYAANAHPHSRSVSRHHRRPRRRQQAHQISHGLTRLALAVALDPLGHSQIDFRGPFIPGRAS